MRGKRYQKLRKLTEGGQSEIWSVRDLTSDRLMIMKILLTSPDSSGFTDAAKRFEREIRCQITLTHPRIMPVLDTGRIGGRPYLVMPRARRSLEDDLRDSPLSESDAITTLMEVIEGIEYAHGEGVFHRDLKPANILRLHDKWVVSDFGLCLDINSKSTTITQSNKVFGTIAYAAPEQYDDAHEITAAADIYALGKILLHCLTGRVPFPYVRLQDAPGRFRYLIEKCIAENPEERYQTLVELRTELELLQLGPQDDLILPTEKGRAFLAELEEDDEALPRLVRLIEENEDDEVFFKQFVALLPLPVIEQLHESNADAFHRMVRAFDGYAEGAHPFSYTDRIAEFFGRVWITSEQPSIQELALRRVMKVGYEHNRYRVRNVFHIMLSQAKDEARANIAIKVLRLEQLGARFMAGDMDEKEMPSRIKRVLKELA